VQDRTGYLKQERITAMSDWRNLDIEDKIRNILLEIPDIATDHHLGRPFLTPYQIAIEFKHRHLEEFNQIGLPIGGIGTGQKNSLSQYIARELSKRINTGEIVDIEGGFLSNQHLNDITFNDSSAEPIRSSLTATNYTLSIFRIG
jgi:hypothetical protein